VVVAVDLRLVVDVHCRLLPHGRARIDTRELDALVSRTSSALPSRQEERSRWRGRPARAHRRV